MSPSPKVKFSWSVWDRNPTVAWTWNGGKASVSMTVPPLAVASLDRHGTIAIVGSFDEFGSANLRTYSYDGTFLRAYHPPDLGKSVHFGDVQEINDNVKAVVGFESEAGWKEVIGDLDLESGKMENFHRSY